MKTIVTTSYKEYNIVCGDKLLEKQLQYTIRKRPIDGERKTLVIEEKYLIKENDIKENKEIYSIWNKPYWTDGNMKEICNYYYNKIHK